MNINWFIVLPIIATVVAVILLLTKKNKNGNS